MKNYLLTLPFLFCAPLFLAAQGPQFEWAASINMGLPNGGPGADVYDFEADAAGNTYLYGVMYTKVDFGNGLVLSLLNPGQELLFLAKISPSGKPLWATRVSAPGGQNALDEFNNSPGLAVDPQGNIYIAGTLNSTALDFGNGVTLTEACQWCAEPFVAKYNPDGKALWAKRLGSSNGFNNEGTKMEIVGGFLYCTGIVKGGSLDLGNGIKYNDLKPGGFVAQLQPSDGKTLWVRFIVNENNSIFSPNLMAAGKDGEVWIGGTYKGKLTFGSTLGITLTLPEYNPSKTNQFLVQYSPGGKALKAYNVNATRLEMVELEWEPISKGLYIVCDYMDTLRTGNTILKENKASPYFTGTLLHLSANGFDEVISVARYAQELYVLTGVATDQAGRYFLSGFTQYNSTLIGEELIFNQGCYDAYLAQGTLSGGVDWARGVGGSGCESIFGAYYGKCLDTDQQGNLYVSGAYLTRMDFDNSGQEGTGLVVAKLKTGTVSAAEPAAADLIAAFPNPSDGTFRLHLPEDWPAASGWLSLRDLQGQQVHAQAFSGGDTEIQVTLPAGIYTLTLQCAERLAQAKVVVQRER